MAENAVDGLNEQLNPLPLTKPTPMEAAVEASVTADSPDVDWRQDDGVAITHPVKSGPKVRSALGQRFGKRLSEDQACVRCQNGHGPFSTCAVGVTSAGTVMFEGSCMGCSFNGEASLCSFRKFLFSSY